MLDGARIGDFVLYEPNQQPEEDLTEVEAEKQPWTEAWEPYQLKKNLGRCHGVLVRLPD